MNFEFATATRIIFGAGKLKEISGLAREFGRHALVVTGKNPARAERLLALLKEASGIFSATTLPVQGEPTLLDVQKGVNFAKAAGCDLVIAFGGGSAIDAGKAIAAMLTNTHGHEPLLSRSATTLSSPSDGEERVGRGVVGSELLDYVEVIGRGRALTQPSAPFIAIPTTAGAGAEVTRNAVLASPEHKFKVSLRSPLMLPRLALVDPELTFDLPPAITASTGLDALTQLIEPFTSCRANPMTDALCVEGIGRAVRSLRTTFADGKNISAREDMCIASLFGGLALANAGLGAVHGFAAPIGGMFPAPHGAVCAALLPHVMAANLRALRARSPESDARRRYDEVARSLTGNPSATGDDGVGWVNELVRDLQIPKLREYGVRTEHVGELVGKAAQASSMKANPITLTPDELTEILRAAV
ncbi:MAG: iron-containing alcohol dehydrogenase [Verrucomicrobia bacterium]|nr:iron-containing alcohol dehydrogenase [Verrucomicrobiota bacterium]